MSTLIKTAKQSKTIDFKIGDRVVFDNYISEDRGSAGYFTKGFGTVVKINKISLNVSTKDGNIWSVRKDQAQNIENMF